MSALPYIPLFVADYLADTSHLSTLEHGAYLLLIFNYWQRGQALPAGDAALARIARVTEKEWAKIKPSLSPFFKEQDGMWSHGRIEDELEKVRSKSATRAKAGQASAAAKAQRKGSTSSTYVEHKPNYTDTDTNTEKKINTTANTRPPAQEFKPPEPAATSPAALRSQELEAKLRKAAGWENQPNPKLFVTGPIEQLVESGADLDRDVLPVIAALSAKCSKPNWNFFIDPIREAMAKRVSAGRPLDGKAESDRAAKKAAAAKYLEELSAGGPHGNG